MKELLKIRKYVRARFNRGLPSGLIYFVTNICNLKCEHCFYWEQLNTPVRDLTLAELEKISRSLGWLNNLSITGGEPLIRKDLAEVIEIFYRNNELQFALIPTNGYFQEKTVLFLQNLQRLCPQLKVTLQISLDGTLKIHDQIRGVEGSFQKAVKTLEVLLASRADNPNIDIATNTVVNNKNYEDVLQLYRFLKDSFPGLHVGLSIYRGGGFGDQLTPPTQDEWRNIIALLREQEREEAKQELGLGALFHRMRTEYVNHINLGAIEGTISPFNCAAGDIIGVLDHNGDVKVCENHKPFGNVRDYGYDFKSLWNSPEAKAMRQMVKGCFCNHPCFLQSSTSYYVTNHATILAHAVSKQLTGAFIRTRKRPYRELQEEMSAAGAPPRSEIKDPSSEGGGPKLEAGEENSPINRGENFKILK